MQQEQAVSDILREEAKQKMSPFYDVSEDNLKFEEKAAKYIDFLNASAYDKRRDVRTNIAGTFQRANLAVALKTAQIICQQLDADKIYDALTQIKIPGRMEEIAPGIIVDVSHNIQDVYKRQPLQLDITFLQTESYVPTHVSESHMEKFYNYFSEIKDQRFDGLIITGAPVELKEFE